MNICIRPEITKEIKKKSPLDATERDTTAAANGFRTKSRSTCQSGHMTSGRRLVAQANSRAGELACTTDRLTGLRKTWHEMTDTKNAGGVGYGRGGVKKRQLGGLLL